MFNARRSTVSRGANAHSAACGTFRWVPYSRDERMGLNHQMSSLSCAMNEASYLRRTLLLPPTMCIDSGHNKKRGGARCVPLDSLFDLQLLQSFVSVSLANASSAADAESFTTVGPSCGSRCAAAEYKCRRHPRLQRRVHSGFWFQACLQHRVDTSALTRRAEQRLTLPSGFSYDDDTAPSLALLRSGLFFSRPLKAAARRIRARIGGPYHSVHLRRSDKLAACRPSPQCASQRDAATRPDAVLRLVRRWVAPGATLYIGTTEPPAFFEGTPLAASYRLLFASNFTDELAPLDNNYAVYAVESLLFVGAELYVETYGYTRGNYMRGCWPFGARGGEQFGVAYGGACKRGCHEELHLLPPPRGARCDVDG